MDKDLNCDYCALKNSSIYPCCKKVVKDDDGKYCDNYREVRKSGK